MGQLIEMARFREPDHRDEPPVYSHCPGCEDAIYTGQEAIFWEDDLFCETDCLIEYLGPITIRVGG